MTIEGHEGVKWDNSIVIGTANSMYKYIYTHLSNSQTSCVMLNEVKTCMTHFASFYNSSQHDDMSQFVFPNHAPKIANRSA